MRNQILGTLAAALIACAAPAASQTAPSRAQLIKECENEIGMYPAKRSIAARTALIARKDLTGNERFNIYFDRAGSEDTLHLYAASIADYGAAIRLRPNAALAYYYRGIEHGRAGNNVSAIADLTTASRLDPESPLAYEDLGKTYARMGDPLSASVSFGQAIRLAPHDPDALRGLCTNLPLSQGNLAAARSYCDAALQQDPRDAVALEGRGLINLLQGKYQEAYHDYVSVSFSKERAVSEFGFGIACIRVGLNPERGHEHMRSALLMDPRAGDRFKALGLIP